MTLRTMTGSGVETSYSESHDVIGGRRGKGSKVRKSSSFVLEKFYL